MLATADRIEINFVIRTALGDYYAQEPAGGASYMATRRDSQHDGRYAPLALCDFSNIPFIVEECNLKVRVG